MINLRNTLVGLSSFGATVALLTASVLPGSASAAVCKEMSQAQCQQSADCSWVSGYTTSKGAKVKAYCRNKSKSKGATATKSKESSKTPKKEAK